jgi:arginine N-succinyltransferase
MLSETARAAIGMPHPSGRAAMRMLENEGYAFERYIDIFDGGPTMTAMTDNVKSIRDAREAVIAGIGDDGTDALVAAGKLADFRCVYGKIGNDVLDAGSAQLLGVKPGDTISYIAR